MGNRLRLIGIGGDADAALQTLSQDLDCPLFNDLRKLLVDRPAAWLWTATREAAPLADLGTAAEETRLITLEPLAGGLDAVAWLKTQLTTNATLAPAFLQSPGYRRAADPQDHLGTPRLVHFTSHGQRHEGSLFARLFDAWQTILAFTDLPETIDASITEPASSLRHIAGHCSALARLADGNISLAISDRAASTDRRLTVLGQDASLLITDDRFHLTPLDKTSPDIDASDSPNPAVGSSNFVDLFTEQWSRLLDRPAIVASTEAHAAALACCAACLLSARTGQPESPGKLRELHR